MNIYQISLTFFKSGVFFSLLTSSLSSWAWNSMCHSPVQLAALMSRNKTQLGAEDRLKKQIRSWEEKIKRYEDKLDDAESELGDSLSKDKLQDDPYSVAGSVRGYIENEQDGWPCAEEAPIRTIIRTRTTAAASALRAGENSIRTIIRVSHFLEMIFPYADAVGMVDKSDNFNFNQSRSCDSPWEKKNDECICPTILEDGKCLTKQQQCQKEGKIWTDGDECLTKQQQCQNEGKVWTDGGECLTKQQQCQNEGKVWTDGGECLTKQQQCQNEGKVWTNGGECLTKQQQCQKEGKIWTNGGECLTKQQQCQNEGKVWTNEKCEDTPETKCSNRSGGLWRWEANKCICPSPYVEDTKDGGLLCRERNHSEVCEEDRNGNWDSQTEKCLCPPEHKVSAANKCVEMTAEDKCNNISGKSWVNGQCVDCPDWKKHSSFKANGNVNSSFCDSYANNKSNCKKALSKLKSLSEQIQKYNKNIEKLEEKILDLDDSEKPTTKAGGLCFDCLKRVMKASRPTTNQYLGNIAKLLTGVGASVAGYNIGKSAQMNANMLRLQQGYPINNDYYALSGGSAGFPFIANGLYGLTRVNTPVGGWSCSPSVNPYGQVYNHSYGHGYQMPYY